MPGSIDLPATIARAREGNPQAIHELYEVYAEPVRRYCYVRLGDLEAAQDCVQEVFVSVWRGIKKFEYRGEVSFTAWLYTIANNVVVSYIRKRNRTQHVSLSLELNLTDPQTFDTARAVCDRLAIREAIEQLTYEQQQVIILKFFVGLSNLEIAGILGRSEGAVKALQHRAIHRLHQLLSPTRAGLFVELGLGEAR
ncbi:RNA polymerase sigma factor [Kallotenue papyrolyticum]|uniref:RNA polymerase sigma factor n=1 Tax=Kallotenue papyrolyticum TaxID=1325125 RepID=UPI0004785668|nr:RNA polymerase sigma factor [Kallotenue papyrolyticum]